MHLHPGKLHIFALVKDQQMNVMAEPGQLLDQQPDRNRRAPILKKGLGSDDQNGEHPICYCHSNLLTEYLG
ncbi:MAG: hypothetical protein ACD_75C01003G0002 [uncultured bacterium]|nr:MAG: hypothetical protein ACD_75C01003G0002 [uncultured bacterium]